MRKDKKFKQLEIPFNFYNQYTFHYSVKGKAKKRRLNKPETWYVHDFGRWWDEYVWDGYGIYVYCRRVDDLPEGVVQYPYNPEYDWGVCI